MREKIVSQGKEDTENFAKDFARGLLTGEIGGKFGGAVVVALIGDLGAGKTTFTKGFAEGLGVKEKTKSPTFVIMRKHELRIMNHESNLKPENQKNKSKFKYLYHLDVYRIHNEKEVLDLGWQEIISNPENIVLVEWADKIDKLLPVDTIGIELKHIQDNKREIVVNLKNQISKRKTTI